MLYSHGYSQRHNGRPPASSLTSANPTLHWDTVEKKPPPGRLLIKVTVGGRRGRRRGGGCWLKARKASPRYQVTLSTVYKHAGTHNVTIKYFSLFFATIKQSMSLWNHSSYPYTPAAPIPTQVEPHHESPSEQRQQSFSIGIGIRLSWHPLPVSLFAFCSTSDTSPPPCTTLRPWDFIKSVSTRYLATGKGSFELNMAAIDEFLCCFDLRQAFVVRREQFIFFLLRRVSCNSHAIFAETTAGTFTSTALSFTYHIGWSHLLDASSAASTSSGPRVPSYHITALWQVSHASQAGFYCSSLGCRPVLN